MLFLVLAVFVGFSVLTAIDALLKPQPRYSYGPRLKCPKCRYLLEGLHDNAACPECGFENAANAPILLSRASTFEAAADWIASVSAHRVPALLFAAVGIAGSAMSPLVWQLLHDHTELARRPLNYRYVGRALQPSFWHASWMLALLAVFLLSRSLARNTLFCALATVAALVGGSVGIAVTYSSRSASLDSPWLWPWFGAMTAGFFVLIVGRYMQRAHRRRSVSPDTPEAPLADR